MVLQYFDIEKGKLAVDIEGDGPLIICAPAMGDLRNAYAPLASKLVANGYTVATMDGSRLIWSALPISEIFADHSVDSRSVAMATVQLVSRDTEMKRPQQTPSS
jgi:hypothetical protein